MSISIHGKKLTHVAGLGTRWQRIFHVEDCEYEEYDPPLIPTFGVGCRSARPSFSGEPYNELKISLSGQVNPIGLDMANKD